MSITGSLSALAVFMLINSITPGPNNLMLLHGGIRKGFFACVPHIFGISFGVVFMLWLSYLGMATLVVNHPQIMLGIKILGTLYLLWLTVQMAKTDFSAVVSHALSHQPPTANKKRFGELPLTFWQAMAFQWLNPKAWLMATVAPSIAMVMSDKPWLDNGLLLILCAVINISCIVWWALGGHWLRKLVHRHKLMQVIHAVIVLMTLYCAVMLWV